MAMQQSTMYSIQETLCNRFFADSPNRVKVKGRRNIVSKLNETARNLFLTWRMSKGVLKGERFGTGAAVHEMISGYVNRIRNKGIRREEQTKVPMSEYGMCKKDKDFAEDCRIKERYSSRLYFFLLSLFYHPFKQDFALCIHARIILSFFKLTLARSFS